MTSYCRFVSRKLGSASLLSPRPLLGFQPLVRTLLQPRWFASYPSHEVVGLPALSPTMESGSIGSWNLKQGDSFSAGDIICSVETDKATVDFEAQDDGVVAKILAEAGSEIKVGDPILVTVENSEDVGAFANFTTEAGATTTEEQTQGEVVAPPAPTATMNAAPTEAPTTPPNTKPTSSGERVFASPLARMISKQFGHSIDQIKGTGPGGRILAADVREFEPGANTVIAAETPVSESITPAIPVQGEGYTDYPLSIHAREIAARLQQSKRNVPHYYLTVDVNMDKLLETRNNLNKNMSDEDSHLGVYELLLKATAAAMKTVPSVNACWMESHVRVFDNVNLNVVVGSGDSLYTPVVKNVGEKGLKDISSELKLFNEALEPVDEGAEAPSVLGCLGTFTVMNLGMFGIKACAPIIREPQSCALAIGALENRIIPGQSEDEKYKEAVMMTATLSCDHRVVDGAVGAQWLAAFKSHVENPISLLL